MNDKTLFTYALKYQESQKFGANLIIQKASHTCLYMMAKIAHSLGLCLVC